MIPDGIRKEIFWDIDVQLLDAKKNKQLIIERVLCFGNVSEFKAIEKLYSNRSLKSTIGKIGYLDPKTFEFVLSYYHLKKKNLTCYIKKQLHQQHWS
jgi:hypothetical protein